MDRLIDASRPTALWIGTPCRELAIARAQLAAATEFAVVEADCASDALRWLDASERTAELIILTQCRPGEIPTSDVAALQAQSPLSRIVALLGSWCEGETRSGHPWPGVERVYWHQWPYWLDVELGGLHEGQCGWSLPLTATAEERLLAVLDFRGQTSQSVDHAPKVAGICASRRASRELLLDVFRAAGWGAVAIGGACDEVSGLSLAVWDGDSLGPAEAEQLRRLAKTVRPAPLVALLAFPRIEDHDLAISAGARAVLSKPLMIDSLICWFARHSEGHGSLAGQLAVAGT